MSVESFIAELNRRQLISSQLGAKLREKVAEAERDMTAEQLARFLVKTKRLSQRHADEVLDGMAAAETLVGPAPAGRISDGRDDGEGAESSSIFAPYLAPADKPPKTTNTGGLDELELLPEEEPADRHEEGEQKPSAQPPKKKRGRRETKSVKAVAPVDPADDLFADPAPAKSRRSARRASSEKSKPSTARRARRQAAKNQWDSPLILVGGGALAILVLCGVAVFWLLNSETGDDKLRQAQESRSSGSYTDAIDWYERFLKDHPNHAKAGLARVELCMTEIRRHVEAGRFSEALEFAQNEIRAVEDEEMFQQEGQADLAALLPRIAEGLAAGAESAEGEESQRLAEEAEAGLNLCGITKYIPKRLRDEGQIEVVRQALSRVARRGEVREARDQSVREIEGAINGGEITAAYGVHRDVVKAYPELHGDETLAELLRQMAEAERSAIRYVEDGQGAETAEPPVPWVAALSWARSLPGSTAVPAAEGAPRAVCVRIGEALFGLDFASGTLLWRREVGESWHGWPMQQGGDVFVSDSRRHELIRLDAETGKIVWRQVIGDEFFAPVMVGGRLFVAAANSGKLYVLDAASGARTGFVEFAQPLSAPPLVDRHEERLYLAGQEYNLYVLSLGELKCLGVYYLGHPKGSITAPLTPVLDKLAVIVGDGVETSQFHLLALGADGAIIESAFSQRLNGLAAAPPLVSGRRLILVTDRGQMNAYEISNGREGTPATLVATREPTDRVPMTRFLQVVGNSIWMGDNQLTKFAISPAGNRLPVESIEETFRDSVFDHPLQLVGNTLIHVRRPKGRAGAIVTATNVEGGRTLWQTELGVPPAGAPVIDASARSFALATANGDLYRFNEAAIKSRVQNEPLEPQGRPAQTPILSESVDLGNGKAAFSRPGESDKVLLFDPAGGDAAARWITLPSAVAGSLTSFGGGVLAPLEVGQVFLVNPGDGSSAADPFQPRLEPGKEFSYTPGTVVDSNPRQFVISDQREKVYLIALNDQPARALQEVAVAETGAFPIVARLVVLGDSVLGINDQSDLVRFQLPALSEGEKADLPGEVAWGPYRVGAIAILATDDGQLVAVDPEAKIVWTAALGQGDLVGPPLETDGGFLLAYQDGVLERRSASNGAPEGEIDVEQAIAAGPVRFLNRILLATRDGSLLVVESP